MAAALHRLAARYRLILASNTPGYSRWPQLVAAGIGHLFKGLVESHVVGHLKPTPEFYAQVAKAACCPAERIVHVGNRLDTDVQGALAAGMQAVLLSPTLPDWPLPHHTRRITTLSALPDLLGTQ